MLIFLFVALVASDSQATGVGRDHNPNAFTRRFAGGGVKGGVHVGRTDEFGCKAAEDCHHIVDLNATLLHLCGPYHKHPSCRFNGRDFRLTDVDGELFREVLS